MTKTKDIFLNIAVNPNMTLEDLVSVGLTSENTMLLDRALYASNEKVQNLFRDEEGNFDESKFNTFYDIAAQSYNILANDEANINLLDATAYDVDNIFVDPSKRRLNNIPYAIKLPNPDRLNTGVTRIGKTSQRTMSLDEIAQTQQVLLNPVEVANGGKAVWGDSPNDSWFNDFWDTRVMAAWDEDGTHIDPITGKEVSHKAGDLKLNENGTYYYESLDGRSVYGKRILNKFNTLTTDGSVWNKYDFFDSDGIELKSIGGSIAKNLALVGSMFIPYVGWGVAAASIAHLSAGLFATLGKMLAGSDSPTLDAIEGWVKSTDRRNLKTEYAQQNMWCWENFINLIGDTTAQLREQRAIFKFVPGIIKGDFKALSDTAMKEYTEKLAREGVENATKLSFKDLAVLAKKQNPVKWLDLLNNLLKGAGDIYSARAQKAARDYLTSYYKLGEPIAKAYMTAITVQDTFGEAIQAGASDSEATLLTLGYAAAEAALLSTDLGKWIMPELKANRLRHKLIAKKLLELPQETREMSKQVARLSGETKKDWAKRLFNIGKDIMTAEYSVAAKTVGSVIASGLGEGIEEVSEEALADFSKSCFNLVQQLQGDDVRMNAWNHNWNWGEAVNRYGMSFAGGVMGGGINAAASDYKANHELLNMNSQQALQQLVYMSRNNELEDFWKTINKTTLAPKELSTKLNDNGTGYKPGTKEDNQDLEAKKALRKQIDLIESIINAENAKLNDSGLLSTLIQADPSLKDLDPVKEYRMRALSNSATAGRFLNEWNTITSDIVKLRLDINNITSKRSDKNTELSEEDEQTLKDKKKDLKILQDRKDAMLNGERTREYVRDALFEMTHAINELWDDLGTEMRYIEAKTGKKYSEVSEEEKKKWKEQYDLLKNSNQKAERVHQLADIYEALATSASDGITKGLEFYEKIKQGNLQTIASLDKITTKSLQGLTELLETSEDGISSLLKIFDDGYYQELLLFGDSDSLKNKLQKLENDTTKKIQDRIKDLKESRELLGLEVNQEEIKAIYDKESNNAYNVSKGFILEHVVDRIVLVLDDIIKQGFIHPETKRMLDNMLKTANQYFNFVSEDSSNFSDETVNYIDLAIIQMSDKQEQIDKLSNTPILENLKRFLLSTTAEDTVIDLITKLIQQEGDNSKDISLLQLDDITILLFKDAKTLLTMYRTAIVGARYDNIDIDTIIGFNTTLNELSGKKESPKLAEIDAQTADLILEDINKLLYRIEYVEQIHNLNTGNKYNVQNKTALNKQFILFNRFNQFISTVLDDDEWKEGLDELKLVFANISVLKENTGVKVEDRTFSLDPEKKIKAERESIEMLSALHKYLSKHIDGSEDSVNKLAKLLTYNNFKGLIRQNDGYLDQSSLDIDDNAFIWWLCATAALDPHQFYNNYRQIIGEEIEGQKPIAPIPTLELAVFTLTAAITNGNMFRTFGKAIRKSLNEMWENATPETREKINQEYGGYLLHEDKYKHIFKSNEFLPNFDNIIFVEGVAGSGKTKGILLLLGRLLAKTNPDLVNQKVLFAHTDKTKATTLGESTEFKNFDAHDHDSLLKYMSADYTNKLDASGHTDYILNRDVEILDGKLVGKWGLLEYDPNNVPKLIIIDEWAHYNLIELDLMQRFAEKYGVTIVAMGDYDLLTPTASVKKSETSDEDKLEVAPNRNMAPRTIKLGVSMRTDNEIKNRNMYGMLAWKLNPVHSTIDLHYYEDDSGIYGDKAYKVGTSYGDILDKIKLDVKKMISTLKDPNEKIGYIYTDVNSELYKYLTTTEGVKEHIQPYSEKDAHGREALYYIVENNRAEVLDALDYFHSTYTGITRSEQGSIVIAGTKTVRNSNLLDKYNKVGITINSVLDLQMLPNTFTDEGTREFSRKRKLIFDTIFGDEEFTPFNVIPKTIPTTVPTTDTSSDALDDSSDDSDLDTSSDTNSGDTSTSDGSLGSETQVEEESELQPKPEPENNPNWQGPLHKGLILYDKMGIAKYTIIGEDLTYPSDPQYTLENLENGGTLNIPKSFIHLNYNTIKPTQQRLFNVGDKVVYKQNLVTVNDVMFRGNELIELGWTYYLSDGTTLTHEDANKYLKSGDLVLYVESSIDEEVTPPETAFDTEGLEEYEEAFNELEELGLEPIDLVSSKGEDIDFRLLGFTFNNLYLADEFDDKDRIIVDTTDLDRIDNGYGLAKLQPLLFTSRAGIKKALGSIRKHLEFSSNDAIINHIRSVIKNPLIDKDATIRWAFISKSPTNKKTRFKAPKAQLEYMGKDDSYIPKTLSAIIYDKFGNPVLELPIITLQSPHSIFKALRKKGLANDVLQLWNFGKKDLKETLQRLKAILQLIKTNHKNHPGYLLLGSVIKLWLFTSNGVKVLPLDWNLHDSNINLGSIYVTSRYSDDIEDHNYLGYWLDMDNVHRPDVFISSVFMNGKNSRAVNPRTKETIPTIRNFVPYVFRSDDPSITSDLLAIKRFLAQLMDPKLEKTVKIVPLSPPEVSVSDYIKAKRRILTGESRNELYGNKFTAYRIWSVILKSEHADAIMANLKSKHRDLIRQYVAKLDEIKQNNPIEPKELKIKYKARVGKLLLEVLKLKEDGLSIYSFLEGALVECYSYNTPVTVDSSIVIDDKNLLLILQTCDSYTGPGKVTGVTCKLKFESKDAASALSGFAFRVKVLNAQDPIQKYHLPNGGSFRIFAKHDTPTFDMSQMLPIITEWAKNALEGTYKDPKTGEIVKLPDNVWRFLLDDAILYYLPKSNKPKINLQHVLKNYLELLAKLGIDELYIDTQELLLCRSESEAVQKVVEQINTLYLKNNGAFIIKDSSGNFRYGNIITKRTPEFKNYKFDSLEVTQDGYKLRFINLDTNSIEELDITLDLNTNSFLITPISPEKPVSTFSVIEKYPEIEATIKNSILYKNSNAARQNLLDEILNCYDTINNTVDVVRIKDLISLSGINRLSIPPLLSSLLIQQIEESVVDNNVCVNPIKIMFK